jgi:hypothetical protein
MSRRLRFGDDRRVEPLNLADAFVTSSPCSARRRCCCRSRSWSARINVAGAYLAVVAINLVTALIFGPLIRRAHPTSLEVLSRLLGILLSAVGVDLFLQGLSALGVHLGSGH